MQPLLQATRAQDALGVSSHRISAIRRRTCADFHSAHSPWWSTTAFPAPGQRLEIAGKFHGSCGTDGSSRRAAQCDPTSLQENREPLAKNFAQNAEPSPLLF